MLVLSCGAFAQPYNTRALDTLDTKLYTYAKNTPDEVTRDIDKLVDYLKQPTASQREIVKAFSYWIMQNISYDVAGFMNSTFNTEGIAGTLRDKKGVCQDYAELFKAMCDRAGIPCYVVSGFAKAFNYKPGDKFNKSNHSWNMIYLDGSYTLHRFVMEKLLPAPPKGQPFPTLAYNLYLDSGGNEAKEADVLRSAAGRLFLQRPGKFRWDYTLPSEQLILADGKQAADKATADYLAPKTWWQKIGKYAGDTYDLGALLARHTP